jgi:hypothetical protein
MSVGIDFVQENHRRLIHSDEAGLAAFALDGCSNSPKREPRETGTWNWLSPPVLAPLGG